MIMTARTIDIYPKIVKFVRMLLIDFIGSSIITSKILISYEVGLRLVDIIDYTANVLSAESTDVCLRTKSQDN